MMTVNRMTVWVGALAALCGCQSVAPATCLPVGYSASKARASDGSYITWREHIIDDRLGDGSPLTGGDGLVLGDIDLDGHEDIVSVHESDTVYDGVGDGFVRVAFRNGAELTWRNVTLASGALAGAPEDASIGDVNGDGLPDIIIASELAHILYLQNPGESAREGNWPSLIIPVTRDKGSFIRAFLSDVDGDGQLEVVAANKGAQNPSRQTKTLTPISVFKVDGDPLDGASWSETILGRFLVPHNSQPVDLDGDGDVDIVAGLRIDLQIAVFWQTETGFTLQPIELDGPQASGFNMEFADFNDDGRLDILVATTHGVAWLEQPDSQDGEWSIHLMGDFAPDSMVGLEIADIDGDGDLDAISGGYSRGSRDKDDLGDVGASMGRIGWFENRENLGQGWVVHDISRRRRGMFDQFVVRDIDGDGDVDFFGTRGNSTPYDGVFWLEQVRSAAPAASFARARMADSAEQPLCEVGPK